MVPLYDHHAGCHLSSRGVYANLVYLNPLLAANFSPIVPWCGNIKFNQRIKWPHIKIRFICDVPSSAFFVQQVDQSLAECPSSRCAVVQFGFVFVLFRNPPSSWAQRRFPPSWNQPPVLQQPQSFSSLKIVAVEPKTGGAAVGPRQPSRTFWTGV